MFAGKSAVFPPVTLILIIGKVTFHPGFQTLFLYCTIYPQHCQIRKIPDSNEE